MKKRMVSLALALVLLLGVYPHHVSAAGGFQDIADHWAADVIERVTEQGLLSGVSAVKFAPDMDMSRAVFVSILYRLVGSPPSGPSAFPDVPDGSEYAPAVAWAAQMGITTGDNLGNFNPDALVNREQMCTFIIRFLNACTDYDVHQFGAPAPFADDAFISAWAKDGVYLCQRMGVVSGVGGNRFNPAASANRATGAMIASNLLDLLESLAAHLPEPGVEPEPEQEPEPEPETSPEPEPEPETSPAPEPSPEPTEDAEPEDLVGTGIVEKEEAVPAGTYFIRNLASGRVLDVYGNTQTSANKSNVQVYDQVKDINPSQQFKVSLSAKGWYTLVPVSNTKLSVNPYSDKPANGTKVNVYTSGTSNTQGWYFEKVDTAYVIRNAYNKNLVLTATGTANLSAVNISTYKAGDKSQLWTFETVSSSPISGSGGTVLTDAEMKAVIKAIGKQLDFIVYKNGKQDLDSSPAEKSMCAAFCLAYVNNWKTGKVATARQMGGTSASWGKVGGKSTSHSSNSALLASMKKQLDAGKLCILHVTSKYGQHWVVVYRYTGSGTATSDFYVADPWDGSLDKLSSCGYTIHSDRRLIVF